MKYKYITAILLGLVFSGCQISTETIKNTEENEEIKEAQEINSNIIINNKKQKLDALDTCKNILKEKKQVSGNSMYPLIKNGDIVILIKDFYKNCDINPQKGDLVAYNYGGSKIPIIKSLVATSKDFIQIKNNTLWINGIEHKNSANQKYHFNKNELNMFTLFIKNGHIPENTYFILGDNVSNSKDSRMFGAISSQDFLGKFELLK